MSDKEEIELRKTIDKALVDVWKQMSKTVQQVRIHIRAGEYHSATNLMTEMTTTQADVSLRLRSLLVKQGYLESER